MAGTGPLSEHTDGETVDAITLLGPPVVLGGTTLYQYNLAGVPGDEGVVFGIRTVDIATGIVDTLPVAQPEPTWQPVAAHDGVLYAAGADLWRIDLVTGAVRKVVAQGPVSGVGGPADQAQLPSPAIVAVDDQAVHLIADGAFYAIDHATDTLTRSSSVVAPPAGAASALQGRTFYLAAGYEVLAIDLDTGEQRVVAGTGSSGPDRAEGPATEVSMLAEGLAVDGDTLYVSDDEHARLRAVDLATGTTTTVAGVGTEPGEVADTPPPLPAAEDTPALTVAYPGRRLRLSAGLVYAESGIGVLEIDPGAGTVRTITRGDFFADGPESGPATEVHVAAPQGLALDGNQLYAVETSLVDSPVAVSSPKIRVIDLATGTISTVAGDGNDESPSGQAADVRLRGPRDVALDGNVLYVADFDRVIAIDLDAGTYEIVAGVRRDAADNRDPTDPQQNGDGGPAVEAVIDAFSVAVTDEALFIGGRTVRRVDLAEGTIDTVSALSVAAVGGGRFPILGEYAVAASEGTLYAADRFGRRITAVDLASGDTRSLAEPDGEQIAGIAIAGSRLLATVDHQVIAIDLSSGAQTVLAGTATRGFNGDGRLAAVAEFAAPSDVAVGQDGRLFVSDTGNNRIRVVEPAAGVPDRLAGPERTATAAAISAATFEAGVAAAFVVGAAGFEDALVAGPAAATLGAPLLLTDRDTLSSATAEELDRLSPQRIVVAGGTPAVSDAVLDDLGDRFGVPVERVVGDDVYATSAAVSAAFFADADVVYVATGTAFPDGLAAGAAAARDGAPVLLTRPDQLPPAVAAEVDRLDPDRIIVLGGLDAVDAEVAADLAAVAPVTRLRGPTRYETAAAVVATFDATDGAFVATGEAFPDALAAVPAAAKAGAPVVLITTDSVHAEAAQQLRRLRPQSIFVLGGTAAVTDQALRDLSGYLTPCGARQPSCRPPSG